MQPFGGMHTRHGLNPVQGEMFRCQETRQPMSDLMSCPDMLAVMLAKTAAACVQTSLPKKRTRLYQTAYIAGDSLVEEGGCRL